jgi:hypothetical protein
MFPALSFRDGQFAEADIDHPQLEHVGRVTDCRYDLV